MRLALNQLRDTYTAIVSGLWGNSNYDDSKEQKGVRSKAIAELTEKYEEMQQMLLGESDELEVDQVDIHDDPFFKPMWDNLPPEIDDSPKAAAATVKEIEARTFDQN